MSFAYDEPKYATLEAFKNSPEAQDAVLYIDNDQISAHTDEGDTLLDLHPSEWIRQSIELLGFSYESV
jgi:hypothetical protein